MGRILKLIAVLVGALVVLIVAATVLIASLFDPNDYKDEIAAAVTDATGRSLELRGDLELKLWPQLRIAVGRAELGNAPGFGDAPFAQIDSAQLQVEILPLLSRRLKIGEVRLDGLTLNLARNASGATNWQDLGGGGQAAAPAAQPPEGGGGLSIDAGSLGVDTLAVTNASVNWNDAATNSSWSLKDFSLNATDFNAGAAFPLSIEFSWAGQGVTAHVTADTRATISLANGAYRLDDAAVDIAGSGDAWPGGSGEARVSFDSLAANLDEETVDLENLGLEMLGVEIQGNLAGRQLLSNLSMSGAVKIMPFNPRDVLDALDLSVDTADPDVMRQASADANFVYDANQMGLRDMKLRLDDANLTGSLGLRGDALRFSLALDQINIDRYMPPAEGQSAAPNEGSVDEIDLPLDVLRTLSASGDFKLGRAQFSGLKLTDAAFTFEAKDGRARLAPSAKLYGGSIDGEVRVDVDGDSARFGLEQTLDGVDLKGFAQDYLQTDAVSGTGRITLDLTAVGSNIGQLKRDLDGTAALEFKDGAWEGIDAWYELRRARAVLNRNAVPKREGARRTPYSVVSATGTVENGLLTTKDLTATLPFMSVTGAGTVNVLDEALDMKMTARVADNEFVQNTADMSDLAGSELPLTVGGTLAAPSIKPDFGAVVRARAKQKAEERVEEKRQEVEERLKDKLKGLFNR